MNELLKNKKILLTILLTLVIGVLIGWIIKPSGKTRTNEASNHQHETADEIWTCSMHPQVRRNEPGQCPICGMDLILAAEKSSKEISDPMVHEMTPEAVALANIHTTRVTGVSPEGEVLLTGKVKADERQLASITSKFPGRIEKLYVNFTGQVIRQGERVATVYSPELVTAQKELLEASSSKGSFPELYDAAREKLKLWKLTENQINTIEKNGEVKTQFDIVAHKSGTVTQLNVSVGDYVATGSLLFNVVDLSKVWVLLDAYETDLAYIKTGDRITFTIAAVPGKTFQATVTYIDPIINPETRAASVRAETMNTSGELKPEMFVNATIHTTRRKSQASSVSIPRTALLWSGKRSVVYVKVPDSELPSFEMREVTIGSRTGEFYIVESGLEPGEEIVTNGVFAIDAAAQLSGNYSMLMRPPSKTLEVPEPFRAQITALADNYFKIKNALVAGNENDAKNKLKEFKASLNKVEMKNLKSEAHDHWMLLLNQMRSATENMVMTEKIDSLRFHFASLSDTILDMVESFGVDKEKLYKDYCPMAMNNKGAYWLSEIEEIRNPYFGDAMLTCGEVKETYRKGQRVFSKEAPGQQQQTPGHNH